MRINRAELQGWSVTDLKSAFDWIMNEYPDDGELNKDEMLGVLSTELEERINRVFVIDTGEHEADIVDGFKVNTGQVEKEII